jgi:hypothetical protein
MAETPLPEALRKPNPKVCARGIEKRAVEGLKALENSNKGAEAERTGVSARTLARVNNR